MKLSSALQVAGLVLFVAGIGMFSIPVAISVFGAGVIAIGLSMEKAGK